MDVKHVTIRHFRGIEHLDWKVAGRFVCLIGPGDSTKSTILDAVDLVLTPRRNVTFDDSDFYNADTTKAICIEATIGDVPPELLALGRFGYLIRGWHSARGIRDEPQDDDEAVLTIALTIDSTLEPKWLVVNERAPEGKRISAFERARFGVSRIGSYVDWQLSWGQGSVLTRLMDEKQDVQSVLADARRQTKAAIDTEALPLLKQSAKNAEAIGRNLGVAPRSAAGFVPNLDVRNVTLGASILALHDGPVPVRQAGLGTSRLLTTALQHEAGRAGCVTLIDEVEHGLEPHRVRRLLQVLRSTNAPKQPPEGADATIPKAQPHKNQVFLTTHSPVSLSELEPVDLRVVRSAGGTTTIHRPDSAVRPLLRTNPDAFLARKVVVCEGKTELGLCRALDELWSSTGRPLAHCGVALADGQGNTKGPSAALSFVGLGYQTAFFGDSDEPLNPDEKALKDAGVRTVLWPGGVCTEERIALDLPWAGFVAMANLAIDEHGEDHIQTKLAPAFARKPHEIPTDPEQWKSLLATEAEVRAGFAAAAKAKKAEWFKRVDVAQRLGAIVIRYRVELANTPLAIGIGQLKAWAYD